MKIISQMKEIISRRSSLGVGVGREKDQKECFQAIYYKRKVHKLVHSYKLKNHESQKTSKIKHKRHSLGQTGWHTPLIPVLWKRMAGDPEVTSSLDMINPAFKSEHKPNKENKRFDRQ